MFPYGTFHHTEMVLCACRNVRNYANIEDHCYISKLQEIMLKYSHLVHINVLIQSSEVHLVPTSSHELGKYQQ